jgi:anthranilate synthase component 1
VVLSQRLSVPFARPVDVYRALRTEPSPYMYFLDVGDLQVVGSSPEILVRLQDGEVTVRPIAGTRPRGATPEQDLALEAELLADPKERAEHLMLIDLGRNDVGRVPSRHRGSGRAVRDRTLQPRHAHRQRSDRQLQPGLSYADVLRATFPAGTVSGAPKIRALEVIRELEPIKRNVYAGASATSAGTAMPIPPSRSAPR